MFLKANHCFAICPIIIKKYMYIFIEFGNYKFEFNYNHFSKYQINNNKSTKKLKWKLQSRTLKTKRSISMLPTFWIKKLSNLLK